MDLKTAALDREAFLREIENKDKPAIVMWNRLEGQPRTENFERALKAEVRDALWMLTKQWQLGEFEASDAGSPVFAKISIKTNELSHFKANSGANQIFEKNIPLEVKAEQKKIPFLRNEKELSIDIRLSTGRYWRKLLKKEGFDTIFEMYKSNYTFILPLNNKSSAFIYAHEEVWQQYAAISGKCLDGYKLYDFFAKNVGASGITLNPIDTIIENKLIDLGKKFVAWFESLYCQPKIESDNSWLPERLEYQFECSTSKKTLSAKEYYQGNLDWHSFDSVNAPLQSNSDTPKVITQKLIPNQVKFVGMPNTRWWKFEDSKTSFSDIKPSSTDIGKLLLIEFGLIYANDWFMVPFELPVGSLSTVNGIVVTNNFGEHFWIEPSSKNAESWKEWTIFDLNTTSKEENLLFLAPTLLKVQQSRPVEEVSFIKDEMANMVWAIETIVPISNGIGKSGNEIALQTKLFHENIIKNAALGESIDLPFADDAKIYYNAMSTVPENWFPFVPVHNISSNESRRIKLQRSSMLRILNGEIEKPLKIKPETSLLRHGLDEKPPLPYFINEEEVPRSGIVVRQIFQRTRWTNGEVYIWLSTEKKVGRGSGSSGLAFDQILPVKK